MADFENAVFKLIKDYLQENDSAQIQKKSFDFFINHRLSKIIEEEPIIVVPIGDHCFYNVHFGQIFVDKPYIVDENRQIRYIFPNEARLRDLTYSSLISVNIRSFCTEVDPTDKKIIRQYDVQDFFKITLARIPMMIGTSKCNLYNKTLEQRKKTGECEYDNGGYFIIKGKERVLVSQERINYNIVHVFEQKVNSKFAMVAEVRSMSEETGHSVLLQMKLTNIIEKKVLLQIPYISQEIPLGYIFRAFDFSIEEITQLLDFNLSHEYEKYPFIRFVTRNIIREAQTIESHENAMTFISQFSMHSLSKERKFYYIHQILNNELFPHLGITCTKIKKGYFLGHMLSKLLFTFVKKRSLDDRDHINNKRLEASGHLLGELFRTLFKRFVRSMEPQLAKRPDILVVMSRNNMITQGIKHSFSTGNWGIPKSNYIRTGVSQIMSRLTYNSFLSHLKRVLIPIGKEGKNTKIRQLHPSQIGFICPFETPEGHCLTKDTLILCADGVSNLAITKFKSGLKKVSTVNLHTAKLEKTGIYNYFEIMPEKLFEIQLCTGNTIQSSGKHPFLVCSKRDEISWKMTEELSLEDKVAFQHIQTFISNEPCDRYARMMGFLRACYSTKSRSVFIPVWINLKSIVKEIEDMDIYVFETDDLNREIHIEWTPQNDFNRTFISYLPVLQNKSKFRDYLSGFFAGIGMSRLLFGETVFIRQDSLDWNPESDFYHEMKAFIGSIYKFFTIQFETCHLEQKNAYFSIVYALHNLVLFGDFFGFPFRSRTFREFDVNMNYLKTLQRSSFYLSIDEFKNNVVGFKNLYFYPIESITSLPVKPVVDFTTISEHHNFIANGFVTHNSAGIVKNLALTTQISTKVNNVFIRMVLEEIDSIDMTWNFEKYPKEYYKIFVDGNWIGNSWNKDIYSTLLQYKYRNRFSPMVSISRNDNDREIHIFCDEGRLLRPLLNTKNFPNIEDLMKKSYVELLKEKKILLVDSYEIENEIVAMYPNELVDSYYTLCEIHPCLLTGLCVGIIPYSDHTQAPRITYHASMGKQAIGLYLTTNDIRTDTSIHVLQYPEKPLIKTHIADITNCDEMVFGSNLIVAVLMYTGFNQEDSVIFNKSAIDRGLFRSFSYRTIHVEERKKSTTHTEDIMMPPMELQMKSYQYSKLDKNGIIQAGMYVGPSDVIVGRVQTKSIKSGKEEKNDTSIVIKTGEEGYIDKVFISTSPEGYKIVKVKIRTLKIPEIGDKVASRSAQKGTIGMIYSQEDMPFCVKTGMVPDIIINPLCLPSRMTINQIIETIAAKSSAQEGKYRFGTPFSYHSTGIVEQLCQELENNGFHGNGKEEMVNGFTGEKLEAKIFMGPTYYHRLKHLVSNKIHARNHGSLQALTRQPVEGRSRDGGLRFGEMERDTLSGNSEISLSMGLSILLKHFSNPSWKVLGWDPSRKGIVSCPTVAFLDKGPKNCVEIVLEDGKTLQCTPDHPMLDSHHQWIRAKDLQIGTSKLKLSVHYPKVDIFDEIHKARSWTFHVPPIHLHCQSLQGYLKTLAFFRLMGRFSSKRIVICNHKMDVDCILYDVQYFHIPLHVETFSNHYRLYCVFDFKSILTRLEFSSLPLFCIREFLGGWLGSDSSSSLDQFPLSNKIFETSNDTILKHDSLLKHFGIHNYELSQDKTSLSLSDWDLFYKKIGFRYAHHKSQKLELGMSYKRLCERMRHRHVPSFQEFLQEIDGNTIFQETNPYDLHSYHLKVIDIRPCGLLPVYDIQVHKTNSFVANGIVAHNCMISHGVSRFLTERLFDMSDSFSVPVCSECGEMPNQLDFCNFCDSNNIRKVYLPYACKLLFQELMAMNIKINLFTDEDKKYLTAS